MKKSLGAATVAMPVPVWVVGTYDGDGRPNVMTASWTGICCSKPPCIYVSLRKATYTYRWIDERKAFTVSIPSVDHAREADYFGTASGKDEDKFAVSGLTAVRSEIVDAPYVDEFPLVLECKVIHVLEIGLHTLFVGEIMDVKADEEVVVRENRPDIEKVRPFVYSPARRAYHGIGDYIGKGWSIGKEISSPKEK